MQVTRLVLSRKDRRARELCGEFGCSEKSGDEFRCPDHARAHAAKEKARYWKRREERLRREAA